MQNAKKDALSLSNYFVSLPHPAKTTLMVLAVSFLFGMLFAVAKGRALSPMGLLAFGLDGLLLLAVPALLSSFLLYATRRKAIFRRAVFLGLLTAILYGVFYLLSFSLSSIWLPAVNMIFVGFGVSFVLWYFMLLIAFDFRKSALIFATMQMVLFSVALLIWSGSVANTDASDLLLKVCLSAFVFLSALYVMFYLISAPMKKNLGVSSMDALSMFLSQWLYGEKDLEEAFEWLGEDAQTLVWAGRFSGKTNDTLFIVPYIHFGPFGNLGGSEFTSMISDALRNEKDSNVFVFHGSATHDFNPVSSDDIGNVVSACKRALSHARLSDAKMAFLSSKAGSVAASALHINDSAFISYTRAPKTTEDINLGLGLALMEKAKRYCSSACVVDQHNAETGDITSVEVGSPISFEMLDATDALFAKKTEQEKFLFASSQCGLSLDTIGKNGLKLALFARGKKLNALLLIDSNGVVPSFRDEINELLSILGKEHGFACTGEVMTTDTHQINSVRGVLHPLGTDRRSDVLAAIRAIFPKAVASLGPVKFGCGEARFPIRVFGAGQSAEIASTINAVVAILRLGLPLILVASAAILMWALSKI
ncbi:MAG: DUF2070 family protein [Candidatus Micrarchaeia archaeon]